MFQRALLLFLGLFACSTSVLWIKASNVHPILVAGYRLVLAALLLFLYSRWCGRGAFRVTKHDLARTLPPGVLLAFHFISWTYGARATDAANASLIVNMVPLAMPFFLFVLAREVITRWEALGTTIAICGVVLLAYRDHLAVPSHVAGDVICFGSMLLYAAYLTYGRVNRTVADFSLYLALLYGIAGIICFAVALPVADVFVVYDAREYLFLGALALIPTLMGHSLVNHSLRHFRGQVIAVATLLSSGFAAVLAFFIFGEVPQNMFYVGGALVITGALVALRSTKAPPPPAAG